MDDGWIQWNGGDCPVPEGTVVDIKQRDGDIQQGQVVGEGSWVEPLCWRDDDCMGDIVAYKVVQPFDDAPAKPDMVNSPPHYTQGGIETIEAIRAALTPEEFRGYCKGSVLAYVWRERHKGGDEDLGKSVWYLNKLLEAGS